MSKLHKKMVALGNLSEHSYDSIVAACGEPKEKKSCTFSDIGEGFRATWSDGIFILTLNFNSEGNYCGIPPPQLAALYHHGHSLSRNHRRRPHRGRVHALHKPAGDVRAPGNCRNGPRVRA